MVLLHIFVCSLPCACPARELLSVCLVAMCITALLPLPLPLKKCPDDLYTSSTSESHKIYVTFKIRIFKIINHFLYIKSVKSVGDVW